MSALPGYHRDRDQPAADAPAMTAEIKSSNRRRDKYDGHSRTAVPPVSTATLRPSESAGPETDPRSRTQTVSPLSERRAASVPRYARRRVRRHRPRPGSRVRATSRPVRPTRSGRHRHRRRPARQPCRRPGLTVGHVVRQHGALGDEPRLAVTVSQQGPRDDRGVHEPILHADEGSVGREPCLVDPQGLGRSRLPLPVAASSRSVRKIAKLSG